MPEISDFVSITAVIIAATSLYRTRKQTELENKYNETSSKLAEFQLRLLEEEHRQENTADISAYFYKDFKNSYRLAVVNIGKKPAKNVTLEVVLAEGERSPLISSDVEAKFPANQLHPGQEIYLIAAITLSMKNVFEFKVNWENPDGKKESKLMSVSLP